VTCTPAALLGPLLVTVIVNVTLVPTFGAPLLTVLPTCRSACATGVVPALALLLFGFGSCVVAVTLALLTYGPPASAVAVMVSVALAPLASAPMVHTPVPGT
jgi:hypothetical protein